MGRQRLKTADSFHHDPPTEIVYGRIKVGRLGSYGVLVHEPISPLGRVYIHDLTPTHFEQGRAATCPAQTTGTTLCVVVIPESRARSHIWTPMSESITGQGRVMARGM